MTWNGLAAEYRDWLFGMAAAGIFWILYHQHHQHSCTWGMLEEEDDEEEEEEEDYAHEPISVEVQLNSRIESWVSETQRTMETLLVLEKP